MSFTQSLRVVLALVVVSLAWSIAVPEASAQEGGEYRFIFKSQNNNSWVGIRWRVSDGEAWRALSGKWVKMQEKGTAPQTGTYGIQVVAEKDLNIWNVFRYNVNTGRTWRMMSGNWEDMLTQSEQP